MLVQPAPLVLTVDEAAAWDPADLRILPTVTVLVGDPLDPVAERFDTVVTDLERAEPLVAAVRQHPLACLALVALLRTAPGDDVWSGLVAESAAYAALLGGQDFQRWREAHQRRPVVVTSPRVRTDRQDETLVVTLNRPDDHNAFDKAMRDELVEALQFAADDSTVQNIVLEGAGPSFCSGGDLDEFGTVDDPPTAHAVRLTRHPGWWMHRCSERVTAFVHGACIGAGIELPAFARRVVAQDDAFFSLPEVGMGLIPGAGGTVSVAHRIGRHRCAWLALTGARIDAATAHAWGLVDEIGVSPRRAAESGR